MNHYSLWGGRAEIFVSPFFSDTLTRCVKIVSFGPNIFNASKNPLGFCVHSFIFALSHLSVVFFSFAGPLAIAFFPRWKINQNFSPLLPRPLSPTMINGSSLSMETPPQVDPLGFLELSQW